jgi:hypothetical protein
MSLEQPSTPVMKTFRDRSAAGNLIFLAKFVVFVATFGFAYANVFHE